MVSGEVGLAVPIPTPPPLVAKYADPVEEMAVVEAYGNVEAVEDVAVKYEARTSAPNTALLPTDRERYGEDVPTPTFPLEFQIPDPGKYAFPETVRAVVEAYGNVEAVDVVAVKYAATACPTTASFA